MSNVTTPEVPWISRRLTDLWRRLSPAFIAAVLLCPAAPVFCQDTAARADAAGEKVTAGNDKGSQGKPADKAEKKESMSTSEVRRGELDPQRVEFAFYSLFFTTLPLAMLVGFLIWMLHTGRPESRANFEPFFGGGQITQLVVIIMVAGNVCSLAIAGILGGSEVSAIYGGVVGYILGKKTA
jgi:hypothetical protein